LDRRYHLQELKKEVGLIFEYELGRE